MLTMSGIVRLYIFFPLFSVPIENKKEETTNDIYGSAQMGCGRTELAITKTPIENKKEEKTLVLAE